MEVDSRRNPAGLALAVVLLLAFTLGVSTFQLRQGEVAVVTTLGRPAKPLVEPGLYARLPWPIQEVHRYDGRLQSYRGRLEQVFTADGQYVMVELFAAWRIGEPRVFHERVGGPEGARARLENVLATSGAAVFGQHRFDELVNAEPGNQRLDAVENEALSAARPELERDGVDLAMVGVRRLQLPESVTAKVFERMRQERRRVAERVRSEGVEKAAAITADAEARAAGIVAEAEKEARRIEGEAERKAARVYKAFRSKPGLAGFLQELDALEAIVGDGKTTVILDDRSQPFRLLREEGAGR